MPESPIEHYRHFLKDSIRLTADSWLTDQSAGIAPPPVEKPYSADARRVDLAPAGQWKGVSPLELERAIGNRKSRRTYGRQPLTLDQLAFLLWATQGVREVLASGTALRTVPSAGARHALETYLCVMNVDGLKPGVLRYLPIEHQLVLEFEEPQLARRLTEATLGQAFVSRAAVVFCWTAIPYRMEWRYGLAGHRMILLDAGHVCQNLYLACEAIGAGICAVAAYHQDLMDRLLRVDGRDEFTIYLAAVGPRI